MNFCLLDMEKIKKRDEHLGFLKFITDRIHLSLANRSKNKSNWSVVAGKGRKGSRNYKYCIFNFSKGKYFDLISLNAHIYFRNNIQWDLISKFLIMGTLESHVLKDFLKVFIHHAGCLIHLCNILFFTE